MLILPLLFCYCLPSFSQAHNELPPRFAACEAYEHEIKTAVKRRFPKGLKTYPSVWRSQLYQESLCDPTALSPAGAGGIAQFMRGTQRDISRWLGIDFDRFDAAQAIDGGAYYQAKLTAQFNRRNRRVEEAYELGAASYNAGLGNILKAQRRCDNGLLWSDVESCLSAVTGRHADETRTYVSRIKRWTNEMEVARPYNVPDLWRFEVTLERRNFLYEKVRVRRHNTGQSWCTYFPFAGGWVTAEHCHREAELAGRHPYWVDADSAHLAPDLIDAAFYGVSFNGFAPSPLKPNDRVELIGYPAGSDQLTYRDGTAYILRKDGSNSNYHLGAMIVVMEAGFQPTFEREAVVGGMSGSPGINAVGDPVCIVVTQNGLVDTTGDAIPDNSYDCVPLTRVWDVFK